MSSRIISWAFFVALFVSDSSVQFNFYDSNDLNSISLVLSSASVSLPKILNSPTTAIFTGSPRVCRGLDRRHKKTTRREAVSHRSEILRNSQSFGEELCQCIALHCIAMDTELVATRIQLSCFTFEPKCDQYRDRTIRIYQFITGQQK